MGKKKATVLITGGNGLVGRRLCKQLQAKGYDVAILSRKRNNNSSFSVYTWDFRKMEIETQALDSADYIVHLVGANIGDKRWTAKRKQQIIDSRVKTGQLIFDKVKEQNKNLRAFISASAVGYYGALTSNKIFTETDPPGDDFLGDTCKKWEQSTDRYKELGIRTVSIRTGVVLSSHGGALAKFITPVNTGFGSAIGTGKQYLPWIHIDDLCGIYIKAIEDNQIVGAYNAVAPDYKTNEEFVRLLAHLLKKPFWFPNIPAFIMKLIIGKMAEMLLYGSRVSPVKIQSAGYNFLFPDLESALTDLFREK